MTIGFSTGCLYKTHDSLDSATIDIFRKNGCSAIEIMFHGVSDTDKFIKLKPSDISGFDYVSIHAPIYRGGDKQEYIRAMKAIEGLSSRAKIDSVVLHPDMFDDFEFFKMFNLPFAVENMDNRKKSCKDVESLQKVFEAFDVPMVLDVNHCFSNDSTMKLSNDLLSAFQPRIKEIHLSGFETFHDLLYVTKQTSIMDAIPDVNLPIIIESGLVSPDEIDLELGYIRSYLQKRETEAII